MTVKKKFTAHGFEFGAAEVSCVCCDNSKGWVMIAIDTPRRELQAYVTKTGLIRVHDSSGNEWKPRRRKA